MMYFTLKETGVEFDHEKSFRWSNGKRYDFYIPSLNVIIEVHGMQHYSETNETIKWRTYSEEHSNDKQKKSLALENGMTYIAVDARESDFEYIKSSILKTLSELLELESLNWNEIYKLSTSSLLIKVCEAYNLKKMRIIDLVNEFKLSEKTVTTYLKKGTVLGICKYNSIEYNISKIERSRIKIVQLKDNKLIKVWNSLAEATDFYGIKGTCILACCKKYRVSAVGFNWVYYDDYIKNTNNIEHLIKKDNKNKKVKQFTTDGEFIKLWNSVREATDSVGTKGDRSNISNCCNERTKSAYGYAWKYDD